MESVASHNYTTQSSPSFTRFGDLPPELRIKIWQTAMPEARTVVVNSPLSHKETSPQSLENALLQQNDDAEAWTSHTEIPALLHVNAEARHEALIHYQLSFGVGQHSPRIYIDFSKDTLFIGNAELTPGRSPLWAKTTDLEKLERLAVVPEGAWRVLRYKRVNFDRLQKLIFVHDILNSKLSPTSQLVEDEALDEVEELVERIEQAQRSSPVVQQSEEEMKKRMQAAREELDTLMMVLPTQWEKEPIIATAIFA
ncbi:hypothetical protein BKA67DRAFT_560009 [Truncatella angustata]|uniref:2EXR domain-containing protein n=1 Tax=Truncatella angustata TaxID=152316 RepID=A0A9P8ZYK1_9PEZI|nr:uncharacterized protein BKA67DRAFT_560009 [Truncatella angustata]KAH6655252.1 hypothetical protein BKA67DRAFT_560009 [Truncatella angustata]KAH8198954.1 hypothetical protein TruAng_006873 [Truncatella angustata]